MTPAEYDKNWRRDMAIATESERIRMDADLMGEAIGAYIYGPESTGFDQENYRKAIYNAYTSGDVEQLRYIINDAIDFKAESNIQ